MNLFDSCYTHRPDPNLFYKRGDTNDVRFGEPACTDMAAYDNAQVVILGCPQYEMGHQPFANSPTYAQYLRDRGIHVHSLADLRKMGLAQAFRSVLNSDADDIFWGFDLDAVCAADAPGVSAPTPVGLGGDELCQVAALAGTDPRTRIVEFCEVNPNYDIDQCTCRLTAVAIWHFLSAFAERTLCLGGSFEHEEEPKRICVFFYP